MKLRLIVALLVVALFTGCVNQNQIKFYGSTKNWMAEYKVNNKGQTGKDVFTLKKIGDKKDEITNVTYKLTKESDKEPFIAGNVSPLPNEGITLSGNYNKISKDESLTLEISWNGKSETIKLRNK